MKRRVLVFFILLISQQTSALSSGPVTILNCYMDSFLIQNVSISKYLGRYFLITQPVDGDATSRIIDKKQWEDRIIAISDTPELTGYLYKTNGEWFFKLKDADGWSSSGNASCAE